MPEPQIGEETHDEFIDRCIPIVIEEGNAEDGAQARAICESYWENAQEETAEMIREYTVGRFEGEFPDISPAAGIDLDALKEDDDDPFFITLPVARTGEVSENGLIYDDDLVDTLIEQINEEHPTGIMGHVSEEELGTAYPVPDVYWVGAQQVGDTAWAKGYVSPGKARSTLRRQKATSGRAATSIFGPPERRVKEGDGKWRAEGFKLHSLDLAPYERAALKLGGNFAVTAEMDDKGKSEHDDDIEETDMATKEELVAELTPADVPEAIREQIVNEWQEQNQTAEQIAELEQRVSERDEMISELRGVVDEYQAEEFKSAVDDAVAELTADWNVSGEKAERLEALQKQIKTRVLAEMGDERDMDLISETVDAVWDEMKPLAELVREALSGPPAVVGGEGKNWRDDYAERAPELRDEAGV